MGSTLGCPWGGRGPPLGSMLGGRGAALGGGARLAPACADGIAEDLPEALRAGRRRVWTSSRVALVLAGCVGARVVAVGVVEPGADALVLAGRVGVGVVAVGGQRPKTRRIGRRRPTHPSGHSVAQNNAGTVPWYETFRGTKQRDPQEARAPRAPAPPPSTCFASGSLPTRPPATSTPTLVALKALVALVALTPNPRVSGNTAEPDHLLRDRDGPRLPLRGTRRGDPEGWHSRRIRVTADRGP